eukprot:512184-Rhodomonas_salina.1
MHPPPARTAWPARSDAQIDRHRETERQRDRDTETERDTGGSRVLAGRAQVQRSERGLKRGVQA